MFYMCTVLAIEHFSWGGGGSVCTGFICVVNLYVWFYPIVGPIPWGCSYGRGVFCGERDNPRETQKQATAAGKIAAHSGSTGKAETD